MVSRLLLPWLATVDLREGHGGWSPVHKKQGTEGLPPGNRTGPRLVSAWTFLALPTSYWDNVEIVTITGAFDGGYPDTFKGRWSCSASCRGGTELGGLGSCSVDQWCQTLQPHGLQHTRLPFPSPSPGACSDSCPLSWWCHPTISLFVVPFSSCLPSSLASGFFLMSQFFASGSQNIGASASASVLPMNTQDWFPLGLTGLISLQSKWLSRVFFNTTVQKYQFFSVQPSL